MKWLLKWKLLRCVDAVEVSEGSVAAHTVYIFQFVPVAGVFFSFQPSLRFVAFRFVASSLLSDEFVDIIPPSFHRSSLSSLCFQRQNQGFHSAVFSCPSFHTVRCSSLALPSSVCFTLSPGCFPTWPLVLSSLLLRTPEVSCANRSTPPARSCTKVNCSRVKNQKKKRGQKKKHLVSEEEISTLPSLHWSPMSSITVQGENHIQVSPVSV